MSEEQGFFPINDKSNLPKYSEKVLLWNSVQSSPRKVFVGSRIRTDAEGECWASEHTGAEYRNSTLYGWAPLPPLQLRNAKLGLPAD